MPSRRKMAVVAGCVVGLLIVFAFAPLVQYSVSVSAPNAFSADAYQICQSEANANISNHQDFSMAACLQEHPAPPARINGRATLAYRLLGLGTPPFPQTTAVDQAGHASMVYFEGSRAVAAESVLLANATVGPPGALAIESATLTEGAFGFVNFTASIRNTGTVPVTYPQVTASIPGYSQNATSMGIPWIEPISMGDCSYQIPPGATCVVRVLMKGGPTVGSTVAFYVEVWGSVNGSNYLWRQRFVAPVPQEGLGSEWVGQLISLVNASRQRGLVENSTLDAFAATRFDTAVSQPDVSDYGLVADAASAFGPAGAAGIAEVLLYPENNSAAAYASFLQSGAPTHWAALTDGAYTQFGYFLGVGPYEVVSQPCSLTEIPRAGLNITAFFESAGCSVTVQQVTWLVLILGK